MIIFSFRESKVHNTVLDYCLLTTEEIDTKKKDVFSLLLLVSRLKSVGQLVISPCRQFQVSQD